MELDIYITCPMQLRSKDLKQSNNAQTPNNGGTMLILQTNIKPKIYSCVIRFFLPKRESVCSPFYFPLHLVYEKLAGVAGNNP